MSPRSVDTVLTTNANGTISADFSGHVSALGIDIIAGTQQATPTGNSAISWHILTPQGVLASRIWGYRNTAPNISGLALQAKNPAGTLATTLSVDQTDAAADATNTGIHFSVDNGSKKFLYGAGGISDFLQLPVTNKRTVNFGVQPFTWPGAVSVFNVPNIAHGLGVTPQIVLVCSGRLAGIEVYGQPRTASFSATTFDTVMVSTGGIVPAATNDNLLWLAIG